MKDLFEILAFTLDFVGKILIVYAAIKVHDKVQHEHKLDNKVYDEIKVEKKLALLSASLMFIGYVIHLGLVGVY